MAKSIKTRIKEYNQGRHPKYVDLKYRTLAESPFKFFRGTCHIFYEDIPKTSFLLSSPKTWICGDLHLENFGSFKGVNRLYFDYNDFDEAVLAPCLFDIARFCTSIFLFTYSMKITPTVCKKLIRSFLMSYAHALSQGDAEFLEHNTATGYLREFLDMVTMYERDQLLTKKAKLKKTKIRLNTPKAFRASKEEKKKVKKALKEWVAVNCMDPHFFKVKDIAIRTAGVASIGIERYIVMVQGKKPDGYFLLDIKESLPPCIPRYFKFRQPKWSTDTQRIIEIEKRVQAAEPVFLSEIKIGEKAFVIKELQPEENTVNYLKLGEDLEKFLHLINDMGALVAWNTLRCGGRQGSAIADDMIRFSKRIADLEPEIINYAEQYAAKTVKYWKEYKKDIPVQNKAKLTGSV